MQHIRAWAVRAWWIVASALAGCATFQDRPLSPEKTLDDFESRTLEAEPLARYLRENLNADRTVPAAWGLPELTLAAFFYNPRLDVARSRWAKAEGQEVSAAERPNPVLSVAPAFNSTTGFGNIISPWIVDVVLDLPIETAGKRGYRMEEARHLSEAARLGIARTAWEVRREVRRALADLYAAEGTEALIALRFGLQAENGKLLEQLFEIGEISANELSHARIRRDETNLALLDARKTRADARARLAAAIGVPVKALESVALSFDVLERLPANVPPEAARRRALLGREDLLAALADYQASQAALQVAIAGQYPDIQLGPGYEYDQDSNKWILGLSVSLPVFNQNQGAIAVAEARREETAAAFRDAQARIAGEIERAVMNYRQSLKKVEAAGKLAGQVEQAADRARKMYAAGAILKSEVTAAELERNASAMQQLEARVEALRAYGELENAMHFADDLPEKALPVPEGRGAQQEDHDHG